MLTRFKLASEEIKYQACLNLVQSVSATIDTFMLTLTTCVSIVCFLLFANKPFSANYFILVVGFYAILCNSIGQQFSRALVNFSNFRVSTKRIEKFLLEKELAMESSSSRRRQIETNRTFADPKLAICFKNFACSLNNNDGKLNYVLNNINLNVNLG